MFKIRNTQPLINLTYIVYSLYRLMWYFIPIIILLSLYYQDIFGTFCFRTLYLKHILNTIFLSHTKKILFYFLVNVYSKGPIHLIWYHSRWIRCPSCLEYRIWHQVIFGYILEALSSAITMISSILSSLTLKDIFVSFVLLVGFVAWSSTLAVRAERHVASLLDL